MIEVGATFVARCYAGDVNHLTETLVKAIEHKGFSFIEVLQPAIPYHKWEEYKDNIEILDKEPDSKEDSLKIARKVHRFTIGIFHQETRDVYHESLYGDLNPINDKLSREKRLAKINELLKP